MDWIKRNLLFVIGGVVALVLMGLAGFYLWTGMGKNAEAFEKLNTEYTALKDLNSQNPHPGDEKVNNFQAATNQSHIIRSFVRERAVDVFRPIPPIPDSANSANPDNALLASAMNRTLEQMRRAASARGVLLATNYSFSFTAERNLIMFDKAGVFPLAVQLGEVKAICDVLFAARVNAIDAIRREKVSADDVKSQISTDYVDRTTVTNDIALISPYEVSIRCFSSEVAAILAGFASSPNGLVIRAINVEPAVLGGDFSMPGGPGVGVGGYPQATGYPVGRRFVEEGLGYAPPPVAVQPAATTPAGKGGLPTLLDEKQLKVTLLVEVVKLTAKK